MKLERIITRRLHGRLSTTIPTDGPVLLVGPNGAGKSSLLNAALAVMLCDASPYGPQPPNALIEVVLDGHDHRMTLGKPVSHAIDDVPRQAKAAEAERLQIIGAAGRWDLNAFLKASANKRATFVAEEILRTAWSVAEIDAVLATSREATSVAEIMRRIRAAREARDEAAPPEAEMLRKFEGMERPLDALLTVLDSEINNTQALVLRLRRAVDQDAADVNAAELPAGTVAQWREKVDTLGKKIADLEATQRVSKQLQEARQQTTDALTRCSAELAQEVASVDALTSEAASLPDVTDADIAAVKEQLRKVPDADHERIAQVELDLGSAQVQLGSAQARAEQLRQDELAHRAVRRLVRASRAVAAFFVDVDDDPGLLAAVAEMRTAAEGVPATADAEDVVTADLGVAQANERVQSLSAMLQSLTEERDRLSAQQSELQRKVDALSVLKGTTQARRADLERQLRAANDRVTARQAEVAALQAQLDSAPVAADVDVEVLDVLTKERISAQHQADALNDAQGREVQLSERRERVATAERLAGALRVNRATVLAARTGLVKKITNPLEQIAGAIAQNVLGITLAVRNGDVVLTRGGAEYNIDTASDGERVVLLAGLAIAVRHRLGGWKHAMIDRLDALTEQVRQPFLAELARLHREGVIDTLIVAAHGTEADHAAARDAGYSIISVGGAS